MIDRMRAKIAKTEFPQLPRLVQIPSNESTGVKMTVELPLDSMTTTEKLHLMESIWDSLRKVPDLPAPEWHREVLAERTRQLESGDVEFSDWDDVKKRLNELGKDAD
jgi:hypothetical protein